MTTAMLQKKMLSSYRPPHTTPQTREGTQFIKRVFHTVVLL